MKVPTNEELNEYTTAIGIGAAQGSAVGLGVSTIGVTYLKRKFPSYTSKGTFFRTFTFLAPILFCGVTAMEFASRDFELRKYNPEIIAKQNRIEESYKQMPMTSRVKNYCIENKYKLIMGSWAASLGGSFWYINRDKYLTKAQKAVQARMYAQGLTVALLIASMALTGVSTGEQRRIEKAEQDEEWKKIVAKEERRLNNESQ